MLEEEMIDILTFCLQNPLIQTEIDLKKIYDSKKLEKKYLTDGGV